MRFDLIMAVIVFGYGVVDEKTNKGIIVKIILNHEEKLFAFHYNQNMELFNAKDEPVLKPEYNFLFPSEDTLTDRVYQ